MGGFCPERRAPSSELEPPGPEGYSTFDEGTKGDMQVSTTMAFVRLLSGLMKDKSIGKRIVPIVPDEARTFGMDPLFAQFGIYHREGQLYTPVDHKMLMKYKESEKGQLFEEEYLKQAQCPLLLQVQHHIQHKEAPQFRFTYSIVCLDSKGLQT